MNKTLKAAALAVALSGVAMAGMATAYAADVVVQFNPGVVQYGYSDGYYTRDRQWHTWERPEHVQVYRQYPKAEYYEYKHDRDPDMGWRQR